jgi:hypothetical protein
MSEATVRAAFHAWALYRMFTACAECGALAHCGRANRAGRWLCLSCFDQAPEGERAVERLKGHA